MARGRLLAVARASIAHGLQSGNPVSVLAEAESQCLTEHGASFVTLHLNGELRGCIGTLEAHRPLIVDVAVNAHASAFHDPRFPAVAESEIEKLRIHISVLSPPTAVDFRNEADLIAGLRPGLDGIILESGDRRATFLPSVWDMLPEPAQFLAALKQKAGIRIWEDLTTLRAWRYQTESFADEGHEGY